METVALPSLKSGYRARPCTLEDAQAVVDLKNACAIKVTGEADETLEDTLSDWQRPDFDQASHQRVVLTPEGRIVGWAEVSDSEVILVYLDVYVHPDFEGEGIAEYLLAWVETRAREVIPQAQPDARVALRAYSYSADKDVWYTGMLLSSGFRLIRHFWRMSIDLLEQPPAPRWPEGITLKVFGADEDKRPVFAVRRETFKDQFGNVERPIEEDFAERLHFWESNFVPGLWFLAMDGDQIVGICLCSSNHNGDETFGWIPTVGVLREYRRRGIAEALLYTAFDTFYKLGKKRVGLGVDASSLTGAATLYKRVGMSILKQFDLYEKELRPGVDLSTHG